MLVPNATAPVLQHRREEISERIEELREREQELGDRVTGEWTPGLLAEADAHAAEATAHAEDGRCMQRRRTSGCPGGRRRQPHERASPISATSSGTSTC